MLASKPVRRPRALEELEEERLLAVLATEKWSQHYDLQDPLRFALATGVRLGELCAIRWVDVDLDDATVTIEGTVQRITGQGIIRKPTTKTRMGMRTLLLPLWAVELVRERLERYRQAFGAEPDLGDYLFTSPTGGVIDPANMQRLMRRVFAEAGLQGVTSHTLRKTVATKMDVSGASARQVADQLGHAQITETLNRYMGRKTVSTRAADIL